jgi:hypothetical protein
LITLFAGEIIVAVLTGQLVALTTFDPNASAAECLVTLVTDEHIFLALRKEGILAILTLFTA